MIGILLVSPPHISQELLKTAEEITGIKSQIKMLEIMWLSDKNEIEKNLSKAIHESDEGNGVLVLTDIIGTKHVNALINIKHNLPGNSLEIIFGMNLPMVISAIKALHTAETDLKHAVSHIMEDAVKAIFDSNAII